MQSQAFSVLAVHSLLHTDTTTDTQVFGQEGFLVCGVDLDTKLTHLDDGTRLLAFLSTIPFERQQIE